MKTLHLAGVFSFGDFPADPSLQDGNNVSSCLTVALAKYTRNLPRDPFNNDSYKYFYATGFRKTGVTQPNYITGAKLETSTSTTFAGWIASDLNYLVGSNNGT